MTMPKREGMFIKKQGHLNTNTSHSPDYSLERLTTEPVRIIGNL
jgi:hypothetical protein